MKKNKINLDHIEHHNARRMAFFLNAWKEELEEIPFDWKAMEKADRMRGACRFVSTRVTTPLIISVFFCDSYAEAAAIAKANGLPLTPTANMEYQWRRHVSGRNGR